MFQLYEKILQQIKKKKNITKTFKHKQFNFI